MDELGFVTPATVRTLIVPVNKLNRSAFLKYRDLISRVKDVRSVDLNHIPGIFNPQAYPQGRIFYTFVTIDEDTDTLFLHDFEPFRKTTVVLGIAEWNPHLDDNKIREMKTDLDKQYSNSIITSIVIFKCPDEFSTKVSEAFPINKESSNMETVICDISSRFLSNFSTYASAYEHTTLRSPAIIKGVVPIPTQKSLLEKQKKLITGSFDIGSEKSKQLQDKGRKHKLSGNFYLLVGNYKAALSELCEAIHCLNTSSDHLWLASAYDSLALCLFLLSYVGAPFQLPTFVTTLIDSAKNIILAKRSSITSPRPSLQLSRMSTPRSSAISSTCTEVPLSSIYELIMKLSKLSISHYYKAEHYTGEYVPQIVIAESALRYATLFAAIASEGTLSQNIIHGIVTNSFDWVERGSSYDSSNANHFNILVTTALKLDFKEFNLSEKLKVYSVLIKLYFFLNMKRKTCLMINSFMNIITNTKKCSIVNQFNEVELNKLLNLYASNFGIRLSEEVEITEPNSLQLKTLYQIVEFCSKISFSEGFLKFGSIMLRDFGAMLSTEDQILLYEQIKQNLAFADYKVSYWDSNLLYNFEFDSKTKQLVEMETTDIFITLKNPFSFSIELQDFALSTVDDFELEVTVNPNYKFAKGSNSLIIHADETKRVPFLLTPHSSGILKIDGIFAMVSGCSLQKFSIQKPIISTYKHKEMSIRDDMKNRMINTSKPLVWETNVIHRQPHLQLVSIGLENHVMLLEGECREFKIVLENTSDVEINQLDLKFHDSTTDPLNTLLNKNDVSANELYELEYYLFVKKPFQIINKFDMTFIKPRELFELHVRVWGKRGVTEAKLIMDYAHKKLDTIVNFKRELVIPVKISVYPSVELAGCDVLPLTSNVKIGGVSSDKYLAYLEKMTHLGYQISQFCVLALDFMNMCPDEVEIKLQSLLNGSQDPKFQEETGPFESLTNEDFECTTTLQARQNVRLFLPIKRIDFTEEYLNKNIPNIRKKQFVKDYKTPEAEQQFNRQAFWYRNELLNRLRATWKISETASNSISAGRFGTIDIRSLKLSSKMLNIIEIDKILVELSLYDETEKQVTELNHVKSSSLYTVKISITNKLTSPIFGMIRHIVVCKNPPYNMENKVLFNGTLQCSIGDELKPACTRSFDLGVVFLERGNYEWGALFDLMNGDSSGSMEIKKQFLQRQQLKITVC